MELKFYVEGQVDQFLESKRNEIQAIIGNEEEQYVSINTPHLW